MMMGETREIECECKKPTKIRWLVKTLTIIVKDKKETCVCGNTHHSDMKYQNMVKTSHIIGVVRNGIGGLVKEEILIRIILIRQGKRGRLSPPFQRGTDD